MRSLGVLVLVGVLLVPFAGCNTGVNDNGVQSKDEEMQSKQ